MKKKIVVGEGTGHNPKRKIDLGPLTYQVLKYKEGDLRFVVYKLSYAGKYIYIKGKTMAGSLIILTDTLNSFSEGNNARFEGHLYSHLFNHILDRPVGRFRIDIIATAEHDGDFYSLLKQEQMALDAAMYDQNCLNNQTEVYIPNYSEKTGMYGWIPKSAVMNFKRWLESKERQDHADQYKTTP
jgi:hypothetical protein